MHDPSPDQPGHSSGHPRPHSVWGSTITQQLERGSHRFVPELHQRRRKRARHPAPPPAPRRLRWQDRTLLILACVLGALLLLRIETAAAQATGIPGTGPKPAGGKAAAMTTAHDWGLTFQQGQQQRLQLALDTAVHAEVSGLLARVHVVQRFHNDGADWVEGSYRFPLPDGAAVDRLYVQVGDRVLEGEIREREAARHVYQQAREAGQVASLVRQERANQFHTQLANIGPGESIRIMISFLSTVDYRDGSFRLRLPGTFTPRYGAEAQAGTGRPAPRPQLASTSALASPGQHGFSLQIDLAADFPISAVESLYHDIDIMTGGVGYEITLADPGAVTDRDFELRWSPAFGDAPSSSLSTWSDGQQVYAQLMLIPPRDSALVPEAREVVFVIDTSGSMQGASMDQARAALLEGLAALRPDDRFNLVQFNSITEPLFRAPVPATADRLALAQRWIKALEADGGTDMAPALREALKPPPQPSAGKPLLRQVVFLTDGSVGNEGELLQELTRLLGDSRLFTVAIGSAPNSGFMRKAAEFGRGHFTQIGKKQAVAETMAALWAHIRLPAVSDLCIDWGMEAEYYPELLPDLYAGEPLWVIARLPEAPALVELCGSLNGQPWQHSAWPNANAGQATLATLWARRKMEALTDSVLFGADPALMEAEATALALEHQLLSPWTSMVAVADTPARPAASTLSREEIPSLLPAGSASGTAFPATATGWKAQLLFSLLALTISGGLFWKPFFRSPVRLRSRCAAPAPATRP